MWQVNQLPSVVHSAATKLSIQVSVPAVGEEKQSRVVEIVTSSWLGGVTEHCEWGEMVQVLSAQEEQCWSRKHKGNV